MFAHLPLLVDAAGAGLSKRTGSLSVGELRERGIEPLAIWADGLRGPITPHIEERAFLPTPRRRCRRSPGRRRPERTSALSAATGRKGRALFQPLRLALTAQDSGPEMARLLPLIGRAKARARLEGDAA